MMKKTFHITDDDLSFETDATDDLAMEIPEQEPADVDTESDIEKYSDDSDDTNQSEELDSSLEENSFEIPDDETVNQYNVDFWESFMRNVTIEIASGRRKSIKTIRVDDDIAMALDECNISGASREMKVNAILKTFIQCHLEELKKCRETKKSYLDIISESK